MDKNWIILQPGNTQEVEHLMNVLSVEKPIASLLVQRGIKTYEQAKAFFRPDLSDLHDPFLMKDMEAAVERLDKAICNNETILVYGDYDVDGTTSVAMMYTFLKERSKNVSFYIPDRYNEGYGISLKGIDYPAAHGVTLVVALDCGIKAVEKIEYATKLGVDFIICDHHTASAKIPDAIAVLDPKRPDCNYPFKELSGCGVGYKLLQAYYIRKNLPLDELIPLLDLLVVSIASDIVPITGENRILASCGLKQLNASPRSGLKAIVKLAGLDQKQITIDDIVFKIGPRINAAGRIETGNSSVELLISDNEENSTDMGDLINDFNNTRRNIDTNITKEALDFIANNKDMVEKKATVVYNPNWHKGVVGIVASRLTETYYRPTIVLTESNGLITGSARSVTGFDLYKAVESCSHLLENFGGHMYAAGLTLKKENFKAFKQKFEEVVADTIMSEQLVPSIEIDIELSLRDISPKLHRVLKQFEPFGPGNMAPVFISENVVDDGTGKQVGAAKEHLKLNILHEDEPFKPYPAIGFNLGSHFKSLGKGRPFDVCYCIEENEYRGNTNIQLRIKDVKAVKA